MWREGAVSISQDTGVHKGGGDERGDSPSQYDSMGDGSHRAWMCTVTRQRARASALVRYFFSGRGADQARNNNPVIPGPQDNNAMTRVGEQ